MEKNIEVSSESEVDVKLVDGKAVISFNYEGKAGGVRVEAYTDPVALVDKITDMIPGEWDDALLDNLAKKLLGKKTCV